MGLIIDNSSSNPETMSQAKVKPWKDKKGEEQYSILIGKAGSDYGTLCNRGGILTNAQTLKHVFGVDKDDDTVLSSALQFLKENLSEDEYAKCEENVATFLQEMVSVLAPKFLLAVAHKIVKKHGKSEQKEENKEAA